MQPPTRWNFKRSLSTWLGDVNFSLLTATFPTSFWLLPNHQNSQSWLDHFPKEPGLVRGDFNAHHSSLDDYVLTDPRGSTLHDRMEAHSKVVLNDGSLTRAARGNQSTGNSTPDATLVNTVMAHRFSWKTIPALGSDHLTLLLIWDMDIMADRFHTRRRPKCSKLDWPHFLNILDKIIHAVLSVGSQSKRFEAFCNLLNRA